MAVDERILNLVRFIVGTAGRRAFVRLWTIHIVKYLYMADLFGARLGKGTLTSWKWKYWDFGPWTAESHRAVEEAVRLGFVDSETRESRHKRVDESNEYQAFFCDEDNLSDKELETLGRKTLGDTRLQIALESVIKEYKNRTNPLLHYVYSTEPMMGRERGDVLDFETLESFGEKALPERSLSKKTLKKAKEIIKRIKPIPASPSQGLNLGKFDDVYFLGLKELEGEGLPDEDPILEGVVSVKDINFSN